MGCSQILIVDILGLQMDLALIGLVDMGFSVMFSYPYCRYIGPTDGSGFNYIGRHGSQWGGGGGGGSQILIVYILDLQMDLVLIRLVDMDLSGMFSNPYCRYTWPTDGSGFN